MKLELPKSAHALMLVEHNRLLLIANSNPVYVSAEDKKRAAQELERREQSKQK